MRRMVKAWQGMTLIELMFVLMLVMATSYAAFIAYKPQAQWRAVEFTLAQNADLVMAAQAYHRAYGDWPGARQCETAWQVLSEQTNGPFIAGLAVNGFGMPYEFSCQSDQVLAPLIVTQSVPLQYLEYFRRYFYQLELPLELPTNQHELVEIRTRIPPTSSTSQTLLSHHKLGQGRALIQNGQSVHEVELQGLQPYQGFVPMPAKCREAQQIDLDVFATGVCSPVDFRVHPPVRQFTTIFDVLLTSASNQVVRLPGVVNIERTIAMDKIVQRTKPCIVAQNNQLDCDAIEVLQSDGWRVESRVILKVDYRATYSIQLPQDWPGGAKELQVRVEEIPPSAAQSFDQLEYYIFNRSILGQYYHQVLLNNDLASVTLEKTASLQRDIVFDLNMLAGTGDCQGIMSSSLTSTRDRQYFVPEIAAVMHCAR